MYYLPGIEHRRHMAACFCLGTPNSNKSLKQCVSDYLTVKLQTKNKSRSVKSKRTGHGGYLLHLLRSYIKKHHLSSSPEVTGHCREDSGGKLLNAAKKPPCCYCALCGPACRNQLAELLKWQKFQQGTQLCKSV